MSRNRLAALTLGALLAATFASCTRTPAVQQDEARQAGRDLASMPAADEDYFHAMDGGIALTPEEVRGRNNWNVWTAGNDRFWDHISVKSVGTLDFVKTISSHDSLKFRRRSRWQYLGLLNEPCFEEATAPDPDRFGLWLDKRRTGPDCPPDPFENEQKYPGVRLGSRGTDLGLPADSKWPKTMPVGSFYGYATGVLGLRLFPNPAFDAAAARAWDPARYYADPTYFDSAKVVKPYRVGMSCGFCHIGPDPVRPPPDPANPAFENLSSYVGSQYFWVDRIFAWRADQSSFMFQLFHTSRPGSLDTSLVSSDNINNPRTMNAVYNLNARLSIARQLHQETLSGGGLKNKQFNEYVPSGPLTQLFQAPDTVWTPRVLKDGSDSVGALGALNRVFINIGQFSEEWLTHFNPLVGGRRPSPIPIETARANSTYWQATESQTPNLARFFLKAANPHHLKDAPGGASHQTESATDLQRGKTVFAETCARCHTSKLPEMPPEVAKISTCAGPGYLDCWDKYWNWSRTDDFKSKMRTLVAADDFLTDNFLSTDLRVPVTLLQTNACSPFASNAIRDNIWDNFSSESYKTLPSVGSVQWYDPRTGEEKAFQAPAGGRGYTRPASLVSVWSTAPFLLNNTVGRFEPEPSVEGRMRSFQDSIEQLLWPEKRDHDPIIGDRLLLKSDPSLKLPSLIDRTTATSYIRVPMGYLPAELRSIAGFTRDWLPWLFNEDADVELGPIPKGTPINLLANLRLLSESTALGDRAQQTRRALELLLETKAALKSLPANATDDQAKTAFAPLVDKFLESSNCPDFIVNRGHYFGTGYQTAEPALSDADKRALIGFLKTF
ncbi:MAG: hypothetical protein ABI868_23015 [Acidobacteriota bacterium]